MSRCRLKSGTPKFGESRSSRSERIHFSIANRGRRAAPVGARWNACSTCCVMTKQRNSGPKSYRAQHASRRPTEIREDVAFESSVADTASRHWAMVAIWISDSDWASVLMFDPGLGWRQDVINPHVAPSYVVERAGRGSAAVRDV
jgi:hypothetical protein